MKPLQHHIAKVLPSGGGTKVGVDGVSWCGVTVYRHDWLFQNIDHAVQTVAAGDRLEPCPSCATKVVQILGKVTS